MIDVLTKININCPKYKVSEYSANPDNAPNWYLNIKAAKWKTPRPLTVGSQIVFKAEILGKRIIYIYEIKEYIEGQRLVMKTIFAPIPMETIYTWESINGNITRMSLQNKSKPEGLSILLTPLLIFLMRKIHSKDLQRLKHIIEKKYHQPVMHVA
jgi:hypothetical protein